MAHSGIQEDMSTKPDEHELFFNDEEINAAAPSSPVESITTFSHGTQSSTPDTQDSQAAALPPSPAGTIITYSHGGQQNTPVSGTQDPLAAKPDIILYFLQSSRAIRIAWLLEELGLEYEVVYFEREEGGAAPEMFKAVSGGSMGKSPVLQVGDLFLQESGAITQFLLENYDTLSYLLPEDRNRRAQVQMYIHAAEATFMAHGLVRSHLENIDENIAGPLKPAFTADIGRDLDWLATELERNGGRYLVGDTVTAADTMMAFSIRFLFAKDYPPEVEEGRWERICEWLENVKSNVVYQRAAKKTGFDLFF